jgi:hypothetical protein
MGNEIVLKKMINAMGADKGRRLMDEILTTMGLKELRTPDDRFLFGSELIRRGGIGKLLGQAIAMQARLHGATI